MSAERLRVVLCAAPALLSACRAPAESEPGASKASAAAEAPPPPLDTSWRREPGGPLAAGERAPDFEGIAHTGMRVRLSSFLDAPVIVYFCARDAFPECTAEAGGFRNPWLNLRGKIAMVLGISADDRITHRDFATGERLPFLLVADDGGAIARAFGVPPGEGGPRRLAFLVGKDGAITRVFSDGAPEERARSILEVLGRTDPSDGGGR